MTERATPRASWAVPAVPRRVPPAERRRPPPLVLAVLAATAYLEVRAGHRDADQLTPWVDDRTARVLTALVRRRRRAGARPCALTLRRVHVDRSDGDRPNVVVVLDDGARVVPVCVQLRRHRDDWTITTLATPDDHRPQPLAVEPPAWEVPPTVEPW